jgi:ELWxxDGT repeat protein
MVSDIAPGPDASTPLSFAVMDGILYFNADDFGDGGRELWRSDGTEAGTWRVKNIRPGPESSGAGSLTPACSTLFFLADDGVSGLELWQSDGTELGTLLVSDLTPAPATDVPFLLSPFGCGIAFTLHQGATGAELWISDGTEPGTAMVKDINPGPPPSDIYFAIEMGGKLYFNADDGSAGNEFWSTDGRTRRFVAQGVRGHRQRRLVFRIHQGRFGTLAVGRDRTRNRNGVRLGAPSIIHPHGMSRA